jgi:hypothetical protein
MNRTILSLCLSSVSRRCHAEEMYNPFSSVRDWFAWMQLPLQGMYSSEPITRQQILAAVWPSDSEVNTTIVDTYIHYLRDKIERVPSAPQIRTLRGIGYMLTTRAHQEEGPSSRSPGRQR